MNRLEASLFAAVAVIGVAAAYSGYQMGLTQFNKPGSGLFPFIIGALLVLLAVPTLAKRKLLRAEAPVERAARAWRHEGSIYFGLAAYAALLTLIGFAPSSTLLVLLLLRFVGERSWLFCVSMSICIVAPLFIVFDVLLKLNLPKSMLF